MMLAIDIGSTWTKGTRFEPAPETGLRVAASFRTPTTVDDLARGFRRCRAELDPEGKAELHYSSSAKGGLRIAALGVVPDLTLRMAKEAAMSAGGKIAGIHAYKLAPEDVRALVDSRPDIVLFTGGTDGGNESCVRHNLEQLRALPPEIPVIYAGNRVLRDAVRGALAGHDLRVVANVLPELDRPEPEPAREAIRDLFLERIVAGRGLDKIVRDTGSEPLPTPMVMLDFLKIVDDSTGRAADFAVVDLGGATTDFYSACAERFESNVMRRGLPEPPVKRTVEGDIGMRVSARTAFEAIRDELARRRGDAFADAMAPYIEAVAADPARLPADETERQYDLELAAGCVTTALRRHAGSRRQVFTTNGPVMLQNGRNLRPVKFLIGSGGVLPRLSPEELAQSLWETPFDPENERLVPPPDCRWVADPDSLLIMAANAARGDAPAATKFFLSLFNSEMPR